MDREPRASKMKREVQRVRRMIREFLQNLWDVPEVQRAVVALKQLATQKKYELSDMLKFKVFYDEAWRALTIVFGAPEGIDDESARQMHEIQEIIASVVLLAIIKFLESYNIEWSVVNEFCDSWQAPAIS